MICPLVCDEQDIVAIEGTDVDLVGATTYVGESGDSTRRGNRFYRRMLKLRPHRGPLTVNHHPTGNNEIRDANTILGRNA